MRLPVLFSVLCLAVASCGGGAVGSPAPALDPSPTGDWSPVAAAEAGLTRFAWTDGEDLLINTGGGVRGFIAGVNLGPTIPGFSPGEQAIRREDFRRWFPQIRELGLRAIRVYTIMPPAFYQELRAHNLANPTAPLLLVHGVWIPEERFYETYDLFDAEVRSEFRREIERAVAAVHGDITLPERPGQASGTYDADVSPWLLSWAIGVEWDPFATRASDRANAGTPPFAGAFFENTEQATPTEVWLAEMLDHLAQLEADRGVTMPLTFVNWPTTDPLSHPDSVFEEDLIGVDHNHVKPTEQWPGGYYASYHAYPYYPDFQRREEGIAGFELNGEADNYAGYLSKLRTHHGAMPVVITEFGVPSAMASAHFGPQGRNQGGHSESDQMTINAELLDAIAGVGLSGGFVFEWIDEWFKFTWNTIDYEIPRDRRALWTNPWTNESQFGLVAADPGAAQIVVLDGDGSEWGANGSQVILESDGAIREVRAVKDEGFLYLRIITDDSKVWRKEAVVIGLDVLGGNAGGLPDLPGIAPESDYAVVLGPNEEGRILVRASNDPYAIHSAWRLGYEPVDTADLDEGSGVWNVQTLIVNRPQTNPTTGEQYPTETISPGVMVLGSTDPEVAGFESRSTWNADGKVIEIRLPYQAIGFSDPSSLQAYRINADGSTGTETVARVGITVVLEGEVFDTNGYAWEPWQRATWHERLKAGIEVFGQAVIAANTR